MADDHLKPLRELIDPLLRGLQRRRALRAKASAMTTILIGVRPSPRKSPARGLTGGAKKKRSRLAKEAYGETRMSLSKPGRTLAGWLGRATAP
jgi:hypothetical protein